MARLRRTSRRAIAGVAGGLGGLLRRTGDLRSAVKRAGVPRRLTAGLSGSLHTRAFLLWGAALLTGILCVSQHVYSTKLAEQIDGLRVRREEVEAEIGFLSLERARLSSRERIEEYAVERLGMRYPEAHEVVRLGDGTRSTWDRWDDDLVEGGTVAVCDG
jgi:cell division protein FtsL